MDSIALRCQLKVDGDRVSSSHEAFAAGANVLVIVSASAELDCELHSTYVGADQLAQIAVSELIAIGTESRLEQRELIAPAGTLTYERRRCLYDHLQRIQDLAVELDRGALRVDGVDEAASQFGSAALI